MNEFVQQKAISSNHHQRPRIHYNYWQTTVTVLAYTAPLCTGAEVVMVVGMPYGGEGKLGANIDESVLRKSAEE